MASDELKIEDTHYFQHDNAAAHHTDAYDDHYFILAVRRGQVFRLRLTFNRNIDFPSDNIRFKLKTVGMPETADQKPNITYKRKILLQYVDPSDVDGKRFGVHYSKTKKGNSLDVKIFTPSDMAVGYWNLVMYSDHSHWEVKELVAKDILVLFNAWNKDDDVYMKNSEWRDEYVLNEYGRQYFGSARRIGEMDWYFGQFEREVLHAVLKLINMEELTYCDRGDAVAVARHLSALLNSKDDNNGVLVGSWSGQYDDGTNPSEWIGSYAILKQYVETGAPVRYGQCWVFAGVLCTVLRALGIPARCVTNFDSAHDTDDNLTIDYYYDEKDRSLDNGDPIWNFHVWNDVWMARRDLPSGFGGWQALDATPQEESSGRITGGPMSISAIKQGLIGPDHKYDGPLMYAEVNGTKRHWKRIQKDPEKWDELFSETAAVGQNISTKQVGTDKREDITIEYKYPEGSKQELQSFEEARKHVKFTRVEKKGTEDVVKFVGNVPDGVLIGKDIVATFRVSNISKENQEVTISVVAKVIQYNGAVVSQVHSNNTNYKVSAGKSKEWKVTLKASKYLSHVISNQSIKIFCLGGVKNSSGDTLQPFASQYVVELGKPVIAMELSDKNIELGEGSELTLSFTNPLPQKLPPGKLRVEGSGMEGVRELDVPKINANAPFSTTIAINTHAGRRMLFAGYSSAILSGLYGSIHANAPQLK